jgi:hypothetical protein
VNGLRSSCAVSYSCPSSTLYARCWFTPSLQQTPEQTCRHSAAAAALQNLARTEAGPGPVSELERQSAEGFLKRAGVSDLAP